MASVGYDSSTLTLEVEFNDGSVYQYFDVPDAMYVELMQADSKGRFMHANIKEHYRYTKV
jgi:hypothetical protein